MLFWKYIVIDVISFKKNGKMILKLILESKYFSYMCMGYGHWYSDVELLHQSILDHNCTYI